MNDRNQKPSMAEDLVLVEGAFTSYQHTGFLPGTFDVEEYYRAVGRLVASKNQLQGAINVFVRLPSMDGVNPNPALAEALRLVGGVAAVHYHMGHLPEKLDWETYYAAAAVLIEHQGQLRGRVYVVLGSSCEYSSSRTERSVANPRLKPLVDGTQPGCACGIIRTLDPPGMNQPPRITFIVPMAVLVASWCPPPWD